MMEPGAPASSIDMPAARKPGASGQRAESGTIDVRMERGAAAIGWTAAVTAMLMATLATHAQSTKGAAAPPVVTRAFQQSYPGATLSSVTEEEDGGHAVYRVSGLDQGRRRVVLYDSTATALEVSEQVEEKELPKPVAEAMHSHPRAIYVTGLKVMRDGRVTYKLTVRGTRKTEMIAKADGSVLSFK